MGKLFQVKSKYKNPDKFIEKLKKDLQLKSEDIKYWTNKYNANSEELKSIREELFGQYWFAYNKDVTHSVSFVDSPLEKSKCGNVGDEVIIIGEIIEITQSNKKNVASALFHTHTVYLKKKDSL